MLEVDKSIVNFAKKNKKIQIVKFKQPKTYLQSP